jgi:hypothetical protein
MLGRLQMDIDECIDAYESVIKIIFEKQDTKIPQGFDPASGKAMLDSKALYNATRQMLRDQNIPEEELFGSGHRQCRT